MVCACKDCWGFARWFSTVQTALLQVFISSMGREPVVVNGAPVTSPLELTTGDKIEVRQNRAGQLAMYPCHAG